MLLIIVGVFFICWGPKLLLNAMKKHQLDVLQTDSAFDVSVSARYSRAEDSPTDRIFIIIITHADSSRVSIAIIRVCDFVCLSAR